MKKVNPLDDVDDLEVVNPRKQHSDKFCCCGGHNQWNSKKKKKHHGTKVRLEHRKGRKGDNIKSL